LFWRYPLNFLLLALFFWTLGGLILQGQERQEKIITIQIKEEYFEMLERAEEHFRSLEYEQGFRIYQYFLEITPLSVSTPPLSFKGEFPGNYLKPLENYPEESLYTSLRRTVLKRMSTFPPEILEDYAIMFDSQAKKLYEQAQKGDSSALQRITLRYPFTSYGAKALYELASLEINQGELEKALVHLQQFMALYQTQKLSFSFAQVLAEYAWLQKKLGQWSSTLDSIAFARTLHEVLPEMTVQLGDPLWQPYYGEQIQFQGQSFTLEAFLKNLVWLPVLSKDDPSTWLSFRGNSTNSRLAPPLKGIGAKLWEYQSPVTLKSQRQFFPEELFSFPVIWQERILVNCGFEIVCLDLKTGKPLWKSYRDHQIRPPDLRNPQGIWDYQCGTLGEEIYYTIVNRQVDVDQNKTMRTLCAFNARTGKLLWRKIDAQTSLEERPFLDGIQFCTNPLLFGSYLLCLGVRKDQEISSYLHWFDRKTGALLRQQLISSELISENEREGKTVEDPHVGGLCEWGGILYVSTGIGVVGAIEIETGEPLWLSRYKLGKSPQKESHLFLTQEKAKGSLLTWWYNPPVFHKNILWVTPTDISSLLVYNALEGEILQVYPSLKNRYFQYFCGILPDQTLLFSGPSLFRMVHLEYPRQTIGEHPTLDAQIRGSGLVTSQKAFIFCSKVREDDNTQEDYFLRTLDFSQEAKFVEERKWEISDGLNLENLCSFTVVEVEKRKYIVSINGERVVVFTEKE
jgi:outer membrane protein assembly factor BamB/tetratricopeptide (TPR) repeat protein